MNINNISLGFKPKKIVSWLERPIATVFLLGQVIIHLLRGELNHRLTLEQMESVGPKSLPISLITAISVGMVFTIQVSKEFLSFGAIQTIGGVLALALSRELTPVLTAVVVAGRVGSAFAAEIATMKVTEQIDALYVLKTDPVNYLVVPRVVACCLMLPMLTMLSFVAGMISGLIIAENLYNISQSTFLSSAQSFLQVWDLACSAIKSLVFGGIIAIVGCNWGITTRGGAKDVGKSTTEAVVIALILIFVTNFFLSWVMFRGIGTSFAG
ncbi:MAG: MlaE family lipid ABC transporter permease subunit [Cyanobacteria bacterium P01_G01_bin.39]